MSLHAGEAPVELAQMTHTLVAIKPVLFDAFISLDAPRVTADSPYGTGKVTTVNHIESCEIFKLHQNEDGTVSFESNRRSGVYLSMDATRVNPAVMDNQHNGKVTGVRRLGEWEKFIIIPKPTSGNSRYHAVVGIESNAFRGTYLRADKKNVNVQSTMLGCEEFYILVVG